MSLISKGKEYIFVGSFLPLIFKSFYLGFKAIGISEIVGLVFIPTVHCSFCSCCGGFFSVSHVE